MEVDLKTGESERRTRVGEFEEGEVESLVSRGDMGFNPLAWRRPMVESVCV